MKLVREIIGTGKKLSLVVVGGGSEVIGELLRHGGASSLLLEAQVPYSQQAFTNYLGSEPDQFCSAAVARDLAMRAYIKGISLDKNADVAGIACTASLVKPDGEREGREHKVFIASQTRTTTRSVTVSLDGHRKREDEENITAKLILNEIALVCGIPESQLPDDFAVSVVADIAQGTEEMVGLLHGDPIGPRFVEVPIRHHQHQFRAVMPGSFNPLHDGHLAIAEHFHKRSGMVVDFEIAVHNVDKPSLNYKSICDRIDQFQAHKEKPFMGNLLFTNTPRFLGKTFLFPNAFFLIGYDTMLRLRNPGYYQTNGDMEQTFKKFSERRIRFAVYPRHMPGLPTSQTWADHHLPEELLKNCIFIDFNPLDISSTKLRKDQKHA